MQNLCYLLLLFMIDYGCSEMPQLIQTSKNHLHGKSFKYCWVNLGTIFTSISSEERGEIEKVSMKKEQESAVLLSEPEMLRVALTAVHRHKC